MNLKRVDTIRVGQSGAQSGRLVRIVNTMWSGASWFWITMADCHIIRNILKTSCQIETLLKLKCMSLFSINYIKKQAVQFSHSVVSDSLWPHGLQHTRPPCPSQTPRAYSNSCPLSWWCHPTISSSVVPFSSHLQSFPASESFPRSQFFVSGGQSIGVSASASILPMNIQDWFPLGWTGWISLQSKGLSRVFSNTTVQKHQFFGAQFSL